MVAAVATLCGQREVAEWGVRALAACLERGAADASTKAMWKKLKAFMNLEPGSGDDKFLPARLAALVQSPPGEEVCSDARNLATGVTAEDAAGVLRLRHFLWALLGREHLRSVESHYGDEEVLAERRYMMGMTRPQPTSEAEVTRFEKIFEALAINIKKRMVSKDVGDSMRRVMSMRRGAGEDVQLVVAAALLAMGDQGVLEVLPPRSAARLGADGARFDFTDEQRAALWRACMAKLDPHPDTGTPAALNALGAAEGVDQHRLEMARDLIVGPARNDSKRSSTHLPTLVFLLRAARLMW